MLYLCICVLLHSIVYLVTGPNFHKLNWTEGYYVYVEETVFFF
jgi:hypothetical protein